MKANALTLVSKDSLVELGGAETLGWELGFDACVATLASCVADFDDTDSNDAAVGGLTMLVPDMEEDCAELTK